MSNLQLQMSHAWANAQLSPSEWMGGGGEYGSNEYMYVWILKLPEMISFIKISR